MAQVSMLSAHIEIKSHADVFYGFLKRSLSQFPEFYPEAIKSFSLLEGNEIRDGAVVSYEYKLHGHTMKIKEKLEIDDHSKWVNFVMLEGDVLKLYNTIQYKFHVNSGHVKVTIEFEKANEDSPSPEGYISIISELIKRLDAACLCHA